MTTLAEYVIRRRQDLGLNQTELARRADLTKAEVNAIERGRIALPGADKRRRLAKALRVRPVDLLVAAGELTPEEVPESGIAESAPPYDPDDERAVLIAKIHDLPDDAIDALLTNAIWWESRVKSRIVGREPELAPAGVEPGFYAKATGGLQRW